MGRLIAYGDIHGCYDEFVALRKKIAPKEDDTEVCVGDIITRGKDSIKVLRYIQDNNILSVLGNHEERIIRYLSHRVSFKKNPVELDNDETKIIKNLTEKDVLFLNSLPLFLRFDSIVIVHGGLQNNMNLDLLSKREKEKILRLRYLDKNEHFLPYKKETKDSVFWSDVYNGDAGFVIFGHSKFSEPKISKHGVGIDTGCVYGGKLTGVIFEDGKYSFKQVNKILSK